MQVCANKGNDPIATQRLESNVAVCIFCRIFSPALRKTSILLHYSWVTNALTYYGLVLLTTELHAGDNSECDADKHPMISKKDYMDIFITTMAESIGLVMAYITVDRLGRLKYVNPQSSSCSTVAKNNHSPPFCAMQLLSCQLILAGISCTGFILGLSKACFHISPKFPTKGFSSRRVRH